MKTAELLHRLGIIDAALDRLGHHLEGIEPYHPSLDKSMNWLAAASTEVEDLLEELQDQENSSIVRHGSQPPPPPWTEPIRSGEQ